MSYDQDEGFDFEDSFKMNSFEDDADDDLLVDDTLPLVDDYEEEDPDSRFT